ncbi:MAG: hypothetical protein H0W50_09865 [Parachlamydiaceae bacterium]|nr:hypothetical protein [Parachlamydiaceae bacterium]
MSKLKLFVCLLFSFVTCTLPGGEVGYTDVDKFNSKNNQSTSEELLPIEVFIHSAQGDYIGVGKTYHFEKEIKPFFPFTCYGQENGIDISLEDEEYYWNFEFTGPDDMPLNIGDYVGAERFGFQSIGKPGMDVSAASRGCNTISGAFRILDLDYDKNGAVNCLALDFLQYCGCGTNAPLTGSIRFNSNMPHSLNEEILSYFSVLDESLPIEISMYSTKGDFIGQGKSYFIENELKPICVLSNGLHFSIVNDDAYWSFQFLSSSDMPLEVGDYFDAERAAFKSEGHPGMAVSGNGRACNSILGSFKILDIVYDKNGAVNCLALDFLQYCGCETFPLTGSIRFNSKLSHSSNEEIINYFYE